jgi:hypothetical protein
MYYVVSLLGHIKGMQACMAALGGEALIDVKDMTVQVRLNGEERCLLPQFTHVTDGRIRYTPSLLSSVTGFVGWRPYLAKSWPLSSDKLLFKAHVTGAGLLTPRLWREAAPDVARFIVKKSRSSFGEGIRGPFERLDPANPAHRLEEGEFYEAFIAGRIAKAWYWNGELVCLELRPPPSVVGDGRATVLELALRRSRRDVDQQALRRIVASQGRRLEDVLESGKRLVMDFKYGSPYEIPTFDNENVLAKLRNTPVGQQLDEAGKVLYQAIPEDVRTDILFTIDASVDAQSKVWLLEMNSNPMVHPDVYPAMVKSVFERPQADNLRQQLAPPPPPPSARRYH